MHWRYRHGNIFCRGNLAAIAFAPKLQGWEWEGNQAVGDAFDNKAPALRDRLANQLSREELLEGQALTCELAKPGNFTKALNEYLGKALRAAKAKNGQPAATSNKLGRTVGQ
ncbi:MAG: hypothetical protein ABWK15_06610 [Dissulfuribacterales bacterium]